MRNILLFLFPLMMFGSEIPLPDYKILGQNVDQHNKDMKVVDPNYDAVKHDPGVSGPGYSFGDNQVTRYEWTYHGQIYSPAVIEKEFLKYYKAIKVYSGVVDNEKVSTWYVDDKRIWILIRQDLSSNDFRMEFASVGWVNGLGDKYAVMYPKK